jgi:DNA polymerase-3 subunit gamma/tau
LLEVGESAERQYIEQAGRIDQHFALRALGVLSKADVEYKASRNSRLLVEMALMQISSLVSELEKKNP